MGIFDLQGSASPPFNCFLAIERLNQTLELNDRANRLLVGNLLTNSLPALDDALRMTGTITNLGFTLRELPGDRWLELCDEHVFLSQAVLQALNQSTNPSLSSPTNHTDILTYLANLIQLGTNSTPYSMITAAGAPYTPAGMGDDQIVLNRWLADDLHAQAGDEVAVSYFDPESGAKLIERTNRFRVHSVVDMEPPWSDRTLMPDFPGIENAESTRDWDAGFPLTYQIRPKDEDYWKKFKGTPKAFVTLAAGQKMWGNRFGNLTAIRFPIPRGQTAEQFRRTVESKLQATLNPADLGFRFEPVREQASKAADQAQDFGQLFLGFSFFLVIAALILMALLFQFGLEQRVTEIGTLLALGFRPAQVRRMFLAEASALALLGGLLGTLGGLGYAKAMLWGLSTIWRKAVGGTEMQFHVTGMTLLVGFCASTLVAVLTLWFALRKQARQPATVLLAGNVESLAAGPNSFPIKGKKFRWSGKLWGGVAVLMAICAIGAVGWAIAKKELDAETFFSAGAMLLLAGLAWTSAWLRSVGGRTSAAHFSLANLGVRGCARRRKRSVATVALLASGCFVIVAVGVFRLDADADGTKYSSGTGGFVLLGESTLPIVQDLNSESGRDAFGLSPASMTDVHVVPFRVHQGDEASCLNLNRAQKPRILGVKPEMLTNRFTFTAVAKGLDAKKGWDLLRADKRPSNGSPAEEQAVPAIADANSIEWALGKKIGDTLDYTDEQGRAFKLLLVGAVANSILQGNLIIDETEFTKRFPNESGYQFFLLDAPANKVQPVSAELSRAMQDVGLELTPTVQRLNTFNAVQNTYLGTFQVLGGLGLLLGSAGLGIIVLRNVLERRGELGLLTAVGFSKASLQKLVLGEHAALLAMGLVLGIVAAAIAVLPAILSPANHLPYISLAVTLGAVVLNGLLWTWLATRIALRGDLLKALRNE
ncbi:MAG TPA: FtsX-like permease family protein [Candidatus Dormibacteraeota bacterium]|nr:FtsX-like permease family protein [Candidatus Dormibacteraeota bacterium]